MIVLVVLVAGLGAVGWGLAYRSYLRCLRYAGVVIALRNAGHTTRTLVDTLLAVHGVSDK